MSCTVETALFLYGSASERRLNRSSEDKANDYLMYGTSFHHG